MDYTYMNRKTKEVMQSMNQNIDLTQICGNMGMDSFR